MHIQQRPLTINCFMERIGRPGNGRERKKRRGREGLEERGFAPDL